MDNKKDKTTTIKLGIRVLLPALIGLIMASGCATNTYQGAPIYPTGQPVPRSLATAVQDTLILGRIKAKLFSEDLVDKKDVHIVVRKGKVLVTGYCLDDYDRRMIEDLIRSVDGVKHVDNQLRLSQSI